MAGGCRVYLSSTYEDLQECRKAVYHGLHKLSSVARVVAMEDYVAADHRPLDKVLEDVEGADVYVGIFAWRYGFIPPADNPQQKSITELEFRHAKALGKECLIFVVDPEAPWKRVYMDEVTGDNASGTRIQALRKELLDQHLASKFSDVQQLAGLVSAAVANYATVRQPAGAPAAASEAVPHFREVRNAFYLAHSAMDESLARSLGLVLGAGLDKPVLLSGEALFADTAPAFEALDRGVTRCHAAVVLLTGASRNQLEERAADVAAAVDVMRARTSAVSAVLAGVSKADLPATWTFDAVFEVLAPTAGSEIPAAALAPVKQWLSARMPPYGVRTIGVPVAVLAMRREELETLEHTADFVAKRLGQAAADQYARLKAELHANEIVLADRYHPTRTDWRPFAPEGRSVAQILAEIVKALNARAVPKLKHRQLKLQWYPFDAAPPGNDRLRSTYRAVARAGLVMVVDEVSLFHPDLREAFQNSPFFNNDQVAIVTISPLDPGCAPLDRLLESETRRKLAGTFDRYAVDYDPQCELAVGDERRLRRWLHVSLPETVTRLQELQPDRGAMRAFFGSELSDEATRTKGDYLWASGGRP